MLRRCSSGLSNGSSVGSELLKGTGEKKGEGGVDDEWIWIDRPDAWSWLITWANCSACECAGQKLIRQSEIEYCSCQIVKCLSWSPLCHVDVSCFGLIPSTSPPGILCPWCVRFHLHLPATSDFQIVLLCPVRGQVIRAMFTCAAKVSDVLLIKFAWGPGQSAKSVGISTQCRGAWCDDMGVSWIREWILMGGKNSLLLISGVSKHTRAGILIT